MSLNQDAPPPPAQAEDIIKFDPFPKSDSYVLTVTAFNYIPEYEFEREDEKTKEKYIKKAPAIELFLGTMIDGKTYFAKTWPQQYSLSDRANYYKQYSAACGKAPDKSSNVKDTLGKFVLCEIAVENKTSKKGKAYTVSKVKTVGKVPSILAATGTDIKALRPALDAILAGEKKDENPY